MRGFRRRPMACGSAARQPPLSLFGCAEKRKRFLMVSREKTLAAAFQTSFEMPFPACYGGYLGADSRACVHSTTYGSFESWGWSRMPLLLFCCRSLVVAEGRKCVGVKSLQPPGCGSEQRTAVHPGGTRTFVLVKGRHRRQSLRLPSVQTPVNRAGKGISNEV